jgi:hypothetical protein
MSIRLMVLPCRVGAAAALAAGAVLAGCGSNTAGEDEQPPGDVAAATTTATASAVLVRELPGLLLDRAEINSLMGAADMQVKDDWSTMFSWNTNAGDCAAAWTPAWGPVYEGSGWMGLRANTFSEPVEAWTHRVWQAVVAFPLAADAKDFYTKQVASWKTCNGRRIDERDVDNPAETSNDWTLGQASDVGGKLTMVEEEVDSPGWFCQRALMERNNVAIDIRACGRGVKTEAGQVASAIAAKVPGR